MSRTAGLALAMTALATAAAAPAATAAAPLPRGEDVYGRYCVACHGAAGEGVPAERPVTGNPSRSGNPGEVAGPPLRGVGARAADFYLRTGYMPLLDVGTQPKRRDGGKRLLSDGEIAAVVGYVASLGDGPPVPAPHPERGDEAEGMRLFTQHCAGCHQVAARGGYVTGATAPALDVATDVEIAEAVRIGPYVMPRFSETTISDGELDSIIAYVGASRDPNDEGGLGLGHVGPVPEGMVTWLLAAVALVATCVVVAARGRS